MMETVKFFVTLTLLQWIFADARSLAIPSGSKSDGVVGTMKGLVDGYIKKYEDEEASFKEADGAMAEVIKKASDDEAKVRAVDERAKLKKTHQSTLKDLAG